MAPGANPVGFNLLLWTTRAGPEHVPVLRALKAAGYDGVEIPVFEGTPAEYRALGAVLRDEGLRCTAVGVVPDEARNPMSADPAHRAAGLDHLRWMMDCAREAGAEVLCGPFTQPLATFSGTGPTDAEWAALVESHRAMAREADGLTLAVEPLNRFECYALNTAAQAARLVAEVAVPGYGYLYDSFHAHIEERDPAAALAATLPAVTHVHISENDRGTPGRGHAAIRPALAVLRAGGYRGWLVVEAFGQALPALAAATRVWRPLFASEEQVYTEAIALLRGQAN